jgi:hypothetical protein
MDGNALSLVMGFAVPLVIVVAMIGLRTRKTALLSAEIGRKLLLSNNDILTQTSKANFDTAQALKSIHTGQQ